MRRVTVLCVVFLLVAMAVAEAQYLPEVAASVRLRARAGVGVALPSADTSAVMNPAVLGIQHRIPLARESETMAAIPLPLGSDRSEGLALHVNAADFGAMSADGSLATLPLTVTGLAAVGRQPSQVQIESRFLEIDQRFLQEIGTDFNMVGKEIINVGWARNTEDADWFESVQLTGSEYGNPWAFGGGWIGQGNADFWYGAAAYTFDSPLYGDAQWAVGGKLSQNDFGGPSLPGIGENLNRTTVDLGAACWQEWELFGQRLTRSGGLVLHDLTDQYSEWGDAGLRTDLGLAVTAPTWRAGVDVIDVFNDTQIHNVDGTGTRVNIGTEIAFGDNVVVLGGLRDFDELTYGVEARVPALGKIPMVGLLFSRDEERDDTFAGLTIFITPQIVKGGE